MHSRPAAPKAGPTLAAGVRAEAAAEERAAAAAGAVAAAAADASVGARDIEP